MRRATSFVLAVASLWAAVSGNANADDVMPRDPAKQIQSNWITQSRTHLDDANSQTVALVKAASADGNLAGMAAGLQLEDRIEYAKAIAEHGFTVEFYYRALTKHPDSTIFGPGSAGLRCVGVEANATVLRDRVGEDQRRGAYRGYALPIAQLTAGLDLVIANCEKIHDELLTPLLQP